MRQSWRKFVVVSFMVWVVLDLAVPNLCSAEELILPDGTGSVASVVTNANPLPHQQAPTGEEDCFCCCSHITPSTAPALVVLETTRPEWPPFRVEAPEDHSFSLYHPPRS